MMDDIMNAVEKAVAPFKKKIYGNTFACPVCHLELSHHDVDENGCVVCPLCGVVMEVKTTYGHNVPVVNDVEINRVQPKMRIHPVATHLPIGLFPLAMMGALFLLVASVAAAVTDGTCQFCETWLSPISNTVFILFAIAVAASVITYLSGLYDWRYRYGKRPYRLITLKIVLSGLFLATGVGVILLHNVVFSPAGLIDVTSGTRVVAAAGYFALQALGMIFMATLGHVGGYLVFGK